MANTDEYLPCEQYNQPADSNNPAFAKWQSADGKFLFTLLSASGAILMRSETYPTESARDNGTDSVVRNRDIEARYTVVEDGGEWFVVLKAGNHQEIARSCGFPTEAEAQAHIAKCNSNYVEERSAEAPARSRGVIENYLACEVYAGHTSSDVVGFVKFTNADNGQFLFAMVSPDGDVLMRSEEYTTEAARDNGIASVQRNQDIPERYSVIEEDGSWYICLKAGNHQEIARSCAFDSEAAARAGVAQRESSSLVPKTVEAPAAAAVIEDYLPCDGYANQAKSDKHEGFTTFQDATTQLYYFAYTDKSGSVVLRSEGYTSAAGRDNGIESVIRNRDIQERWVQKVDDDGTHYVSLIAGNRQEIARTCPFESEGALLGWWSPWSSLAFAPAVVEKEVEVAPEPVVEAVVAPEPAKPVDKEDDYLPCKEYEGHTINDKENNVAFFKGPDGQFYFVVYKENGSVRLRSEGFRTAQERDVELSGVLKNLDKKDMYKTLENGAYRMHVLYDQTGREVGRSCLEKEVEPIPVAAVVAAPEPAKPVDKEDDYLPCKEYEGHTVSDKQNNIAFFKGADGQHYFVVYKADGTVRLRSEGFRTTQDRDVELSEVVKNLDKKEMYKTLENGAYRMHVLYDQTGREVGRSCLEKEVEAIPVAPIAVAAAVVAAAPEPAKPVDKEDDYLPCKDYEGHKVSDKQNNIAFFKAADGQHYFVVYKEDGTVRLRSEGFRTTQDRDKELSGVLRNLNNKDMYKVLENGPYRMYVLYDKDGREVGRSCLEKEVAPVPVAPVAVAAAVVAAAPIVEKVIEPVKEVEKTVVYTKPIEPVRAAAPIVEEVVAEKGFNWLWLLPLLLIPLIWFTCNKCKTPAPPPPPPVKVEAPAPAPAPAPAAPTCSCTGNDNALFNIDANKTPKVLTKLGTSPEFGSLHGLTATEVYDRMARWHKKHASSRKFLDDAFKSMGYTNGFADAKADMFSEALVPTGTTGNMGYGAEKHKTIYATLSPVSDRDLQAFRIKSANGCDLHFMKTCGNHFYFCPK
jgi:uncharacterized protein YegP (UPF0339 family)